MARHMWLTDRTGSFAGGSDSGKTDFNYDLELTNLYLHCDSEVASETGSLMLDSGKGTNWDTELSTNTFTDAQDWHYTPTHRVVLSSGDEIAIGVSGSAPAVWHYTLKGEYIR